MNELELKNYWKSEEASAHIKGWDFSYISDRFKSYEDDLPWDYKEIVQKYLRPQDKILDIDTGGGEFDVIINRHGAYDADEIHRILKPGGLFITQQVGEDNDRELVEMLLPGVPKSFPGMNLREQKRVFADADFTILLAEEAFRPIEFYNVGALVWFARIIEWEFIGFSVEKCFARLLQAQQEIEKHGCVRGRVHRYLLVVQK